MLKAVPLPSGRCITVNGLKSAHIQAKGGQKGGQENRQGLSKSKVQGSSQLPDGTRLRFPLDIIALRDPGAPSKSECDTGCGWGVFAARVHIHQASNYARLFLIHISLKLATFPPSRGAAAPLPIGRGCTGSECSRSRPQQHPRPLHLL